MRWGGKNHQILSRWALNYDGGVTLSPLKVTQSVGLLRSSSPGGILNCCAPGDGVLRDLCRTTYDGIGDGGGLPAPAISRLCRDMRRPGCEALLEACAWRRNRRGIRRIKLSQRFVSAGTLTQWGGLGTVRRIAALGSGITCSTAGIDWQSGVLTHRLIGAHAQP